MRPSMKNSISLLAVLTAGWPAVLAGDAAAQDAPKGLDTIETVVVIYAENRSFDNLYGSFPGANGLQNVTPANSRQLDRDGSLLKELPPIWSGLTGKGVDAAGDRSADRASAEQAVRDRRSQRL